MEEIGLEKARDMLGEIVDKAALAGGAYVITRHGKPRAVLVGWDCYRDAVAALAPAAVDLDLSAARTLLKEKIMSFAQHGEEEVKER